MQSVQQPGRVALSQFDFILDFIYFVLDIFIYFWGFFFNDISKMP